MIAFVWDGASWQIGELARGYWRAETGEWLRNRWSGAPLGADALTAPIVYPPPPGDAADA